MGILIVVANDSGSNRIAKQILREVFQVLLSSYRMIMESGLPYPPAPASQFVNSKGGAAFQGCDDLL